MARRVAIGLCAIGTAAIVVVCEFFREALRGNGWYHNRGGDRLVLLRCLVVVVLDHPQRAGRGAVGLMAIVVVGTVPFGLAVVVVGARRLVTGPQRGGEQQGVLLFASGADCHRGD